jgi:AcrR family transcriptional regulator
MEKKEIRHRRIRDQILQAARELLLENGHDNLSLRGIARRVQYSPASLYEYFDNKDHIIDELCLQTEIEFAQKMMEAANASVQEHPITEMCLTYIEMALNKADDFRLLYQRSLPNEHPPKIFDALLEEITKSVDSGEFFTMNHFEEREITYTFLSLVHGQALLALTRDLYADSSQNHIRRIAIKQLLQGMRD